MVPGLGHLAHRIFACSMCGHIQIMAEPVGVPREDVFDGWRKEAAH
jgi:hypothetical protein